MVANAFDGRFGLDLLASMEIFVRVAECGSFSRAAESIGQSNASVTMCVRNLERHLSVTLINRDTRRLRLTEEGQAYLESSRELLAKLARGEEIVRALGGKLCGRLRILASISIWHELLSPRFPEFIAKYPDITTALTLSNQPHNLIERGIDVAVQLDHVEEVHLVARPICESRFVVCCSPALANSLPAHPGDIDDRQCIGLLSNDKRSINPWTLRSGDATVAIRPAGPLHFNCSNELLVAARAGAGVACVLGVLANRHLAEGTLVRLYPEWIAPTKTLYLVMQKTRVDLEKVRVFADFVSRVVRDQIS